MLFEIYESGEFNGKCGYTEICNYISELGIECKKDFIKKHDKIPEDEIDALDTRYMEGKFVWKYCYNEVFIEFHWEDSVPFSGGEVILQYHKNIDKDILENIRRDIINFFCCPTYSAKNYDEYIKEYGISYYSKH